MDLFNIYNNEVPAKGNLLLSEPLLPDPNFERTAILLCEHNDEGSFGFVLNKKAPVKLSEIMDYSSAFDDDLYLGGPVQQDTLHFIHTNALELEGGNEILDNVVWGGNFEQLMAYVNNEQIQRDDIRFFLGYSGWSPGQLEEELRQNSWILFKNVTTSMIFEEQYKESLWKEVLNQMGGKYKLFPNYPKDPNLN
ncbi:MAG: YqgE/AlgH family protein [Bacteroidota bacterium]